jgi:hypothetical protein
MLPVMGWLENSVSLRPLWRAQRMTLLSVNASRGSFAMRYFADELWLGAMDNGS